MEAGASLRAVSGRFVFPLVVCIVLAAARTAAQAPQPATTLDAGIARLKAGDHFGAVFILNDVVRQVTGNELARAHAYLAVAYLGTDRPDRARASADRALEVDPGLLVAGPEFPPEAVKLFADARSKVPPPLPPPPGPAVVTPPAVVTETTRATGTIVVYSPTQNFLGASTKWISVECNGQKVAEIKNDRFLELTAPAGSQVVKVARSTLSLQVVAGEDYYIRVAARPFGWNVGVVKGEQARAEIEQKSVSRNDAERTFSAECKAPAPGRRGP